MGFSLDNVLGSIYVTAWSISMYPPLLMNYKHRSTKGISVDFVMLNTAGYTYLVISMILQLYFWQLPKVGLSESETEIEALIARPKVTNFDLWYCLHGFIMNFVLVSQILWGRTLWKFVNDSKYRRMKSSYHRILVVSLIVFSVLTLNFTYTNINLGWNNTKTLSYCNSLFLLKISMSLIKYIPQVKHNYDRKSLKGFAIQGVILDVSGGCASILQLLVQLSNDQGFSAMTFLTNFGKIGLALVTLIFNFIFISQWLLYGD